MSGESGNDPERKPTEIDTSRAHSARVYDYWLGGKDNYAADRALGDRILQVVPRQRRHVRANRAFLVRAVRHLVAEAGIRQILDIGAGLPTAPNVHQVAHAIAPATRVLYVDNDPIVLSHARALMPDVDSDRVAVVDADLCDPASILKHPTLVRMFDPTAPTAVLLLAMLMSLTAEDDPYSVVAELLQPFPSGSYLVATHTTADLDPLAMDGYVKAAHAAGMTFTPRRLAEFEAFFAGLVLVSPGVVPVLAWRPDSSLAESSVDSVYIYSGVGRKP